jgi:hypothetical protein
VSAEEWAIVNAMVNFCRNNGLMFAEVEHQDFKATLKADDYGFELEIDRPNLNGG